MEISQKIPEIIKKHFFSRDLLIEISSKGCKKLQKYQKSVFFDFFTHFLTILTRDFHFSQKVKKCNYECSVMSESIIFAKMHTFRDLIHSWFHFFHFFDFFKLQDLVRKFEQFSRFFAFFAVFYEIASLTHRRSMIKNVLEFLIN